MRWSALIADILVFIPAAIAALQCYRVGKQNTQSKQSLEDSPYLWLVLLCPSLLIIDHGHFQVQGNTLTGHFLCVVADLAADINVQYNGISLGLVLWAFVFILRGIPSN